MSRRVAPESILWRGVHMHTKTETAVTAASIYIRGQKSMALLRYSVVCLSSDVGKASATVAQQSPTAESDGTSPRQRRVGYRNHYRFDEALIAVFDGCQSTRQLFVLGGSFAVLYTRTIVRTVRHIVVGLSAIRSV